jgi:tyrosine-protein kinase Etk/Wzc
MTNTPDQNQNQNRQLPSSVQFKPTDMTEDILGLMNLFLRHWIIFAVFSFIGLVLGVTYARYSRDVFQSSAMLQLDTKSKSGKAIAEIGDLFETQSPALAEIHLIKSLSVLMPVVEKLHLNYSAEPIDVVDRFMRREGRMDLDLFEPPVALSTKDDKWIAEVKSTDSYELFSPLGASVVVGKVGETYRVPVGPDTVAICVKSVYALPGQRFVLGKASILSVAESLQKKVDAEEKGKNTNILEISYTDRYPDRTADVLNAIAKTYVRQNVEMRSAEAEKSLEFLEEQLPMIKAKLDSSQQLLTSYRNKVGTVDLGIEARGTLERQVQLKTQLLSLQQEYQEKSRLFKQDHPAMLAIVQQQERLRKEIVREEGKTKALPTTQQDVLKLQQDVEINNQLYTSVLNNIQQLRVVRASEIGNVRIVDPAYVHEKPIMPNRKKIVLIGFGGGFGFAWILVLLLHRLRNRGVGSSSEIERETGVSVYAKIPKTHISHKLPGVNDKRFILAKADSQDIAIEKLRALRTALEFSCFDECGRVLMVTGIAPEAGKSFVSLNLAYLFAKHDKRVLFIDADLRKSRLSHKREKGVSDIIHKTCSLENAAVDMGDGCFFLPNGSRVVNPGEMLASKAFAELLQECREKYDVVVVDTPPNSLVSDAQSIAKLVDFGLIVIEYKKHSMENIQETIDQLSIAKLEKKAIVLNQCVHDGSSYGYGYGYGYGYRYKYGEKK